MDQSEEKGIIVDYPWKLIPAPIPCCGSYIVVSMRPLREKEGDINDYPDMDLYRFLAKTALNYFNSNQGTKFTFVKLVNKCTVVGPKCSTHLNFMATDGNGDGEITDGNGDGEIFYAELIHKGVKDGTKEDEINANQVQLQIKACSLLQKVDTPNPLGNKCTKCSDMSVIHPGPRDGYRVLAGDTFESSGLMGYNFNKVREALQPELVWGRSKLEHTKDHFDMFKACANQVLRHFNRKQETEFHLVKILVGFSVTLTDEIVAHFNFLAEWPKKLEETKLFFAEAVVPMLSSGILGAWYPFVEE